MFCNGCARKFGLLEKRLGCPECHFSFCRKCLKHEAKDPIKEAATRHVCAKCYLKHVKMEPPLDTVDEYSQKFRRCIEKMCESDKNVKINFKDRKETFANVRQGFDHETQQLQSRLQALEEDYNKTRPKLKTETEISERLEKIQIKPTTSKRPQIAAYHPPDTRTEAECADQLMQQFMEELAIDEEVPKPELELEERLARLRGDGIYKDSKQVADESAGRRNLQRSPEMESPTPSKKPTKGIWGLDLPRSEHSEDDDDELAAQAIVKKALLDAEMGKLNVDEDEHLEDLGPKEYPWCVVCNENATVKCLDCDGDLYCDACFIECCKPEEHSSEPFVKESQDTE